MVASHRRRRIKGVRPVVEDDAKEKDRSIGYRLQGKEVVD
jgi:hypothetical protein